MEEAERNQLCNLQEKLQHESRSRLQQEAINSKLMTEQDSLRKKLAEAELHIDQLRLGANVDINKRFILSHKTKQCTTLHQRLELPGPISWPGALSPSPVTEEGKKEKNHVTIVDGKYSDSGFARRDHVISEEKPGTFDQPPRINDRSYLSEKIPSEAANSAQCVERLKASPTPPSSVSTTSEEYLIASLSPSSSKGNHHETIDILTTPSNRSHQISFHPTYYERKFHMECSHDKEDSSFFCNITPPDNFSHDTSVSEDYDYPSALPPPPFNLSDTAIDPFLSCDKDDRTSSNFDEQVKVESHLLSQLFRIHSVLEQVSLLKQKAGQEDCTLEELSDDLGGVLLEHEKLVVEIGEPGQGVAVMERRYSDHISERSREALEDGLVALAEDLKNLDDILRYRAALPTRQDRQQQDNNITTDDMEENLSLLTRKPLEISGCDGSHFPNIDNSNNSVVSSSLLSKYLPEMDSNSTDTSSEMAMDSHSLLSDLEELCLTEVGDGNGEHHHQRTGGKEINHTHSQKGTRMNPLQFHPSNTTAQNVKQSGECGRNDRKVKSLIPVMTLSRSPEETEQFGEGENEQSGAGDESVGAHSGGMDYGQNGRGCGERGGSLQIGRGAGGRQSEREGGGRQALGRGGKLRGTQGFRSRIPRLVKGEKSLVRGRGEPLWQPNSFSTGTDIGSAIAVSPSARSEVEKSLVSLSHASKSSPLSHPSKLSAPTSHYSKLATPTSRSTKPSMTQTLPSRSMTPPSHSSKISTPKTGLGLEDKESHKEQNRSSPVHTRVDYQRVLPVTQLHPFHIDHSQEEINSNGQREARHRVPLVNMGTDYQDAAEIHSQQSRENEEESQTYHRPADLTLQGDGNMTRAAVRARSLASQDKLTNLSLVPTQHHHHDRAQSSPVEDDEAKKQTLAAENQGTGHSQVDPNYHVNTPLPPPMSRSSDGQTAPAAPPQLPCRLSSTESQGEDKHFLTAVYRQLSQGDKNGHNLNLVPFDQHRTSCGKNGRDDQLLAAAHRRTSNASTESHVSGCRMSHHSSDHSQNQGISDPDNWESDAAHSGMSEHNIDGKLSPGRHDIKCHHVNTSSDDHSQPAHSHSNGSITHSNMHLTLAATTPQLSPVCLGRDNKQFLAAHMEMIDLHSQQNQCKGEHLTQIPGCKNDILLATNSNVTVTPCLSLSSQNKNCLIHHSLDTPQSSSGSHTIDCQAPTSRSTSQSCATQYEGSIQSLADSEAHLNPGVHIGNRGRDDQMSGLNTAEVNATSRSLASGDVLSSLTRSSEHSFGKYHSQCGTFMPRQSGRMTRAYMDSLRKELERLKQQVMRSSQSHGSQRTNQSQSMPREHTTASLSPSSNALSSASDFKDASPASSTTTQSSATCSISGTAGSLNIWGACAAQFLQIPSQGTSWTELHSDSVTPSEESLKKSSNMHSVLTASLCSSPSPLTISTQHPLSAWDGVRHHLGTPVRSSSHASSNPTVSSAGGGGQGRRTHLVDSTSDSPGSTPHQSNTQSLMGPCSSACLSQILPVVDDSELGSHSQPAWLSDSQVQWPLESLRQTSLPSGSYSQPAWSSDSQVQPHWSPASSRQPSLPSGSHSQPAWSSSLVQSSQSSRQPSLPSGSHNQLAWSSDSQVQPSESSRQPLLPSGSHSQSAWSSDSQVQPHRPSESSSQPSLPAGSHNQSMLLSNQPSWPTRSAGYSQPSWSTGSDGRSQPSWPAGSDGHSMPSWPAGSQPVLLSGDHSQPSWPLEDSTPYQLPGVITPTLTELGSLPAPTPSDTASQIEAGIPAPLSSTPISDNNTPLWSKGNILASSMNNVPTQHNSTLSDSGGNTPLQSNSGTPNFTISTPLSSAAALSEGNTPSWINTNAATSLENFSAPSSTTPEGATPVQSRASLSRGSSSNASTPMRSNPTLSWTKRNSVPSLDCNFTSPLSSTPVLTRHSTHSWSKDHVSLSARHSCGSLPDNIFSPVLINTTSWAEDTNTNHASLEDLQPLTQSTLDPDSNTVTLEHPFTEIPGDPQTTSYEEEDLMSSPHSPVFDSTMKLEDSGVGNTSCSRYSSPIPTGRVLGEFENLSGLLQSTESTQDELHTNAILAKEVKSARGEKSYLHHDSPRTSSSAHKSSISHSSEDRWSYRTYDQQPADGSNYGDDENDSGGFRLSEGSLSKSGDSRSRPRLHGHYQGRKFRPSGSTGSESSKHDEQIASPSHSSDLIQVTSSHELPLQLSRSSSKQSSHRHVSSHLSSSHDHDYSPIATRRHRSPLGPAHSGSLPEHTYSRPTSSHRSPIRYSHSGNSLGHTFSASSTHHRSHPSRHSFSNGHRSQMQSSRSNTSKHTFSQQPNNHRSPIRFHHSNNSSVEVSHQPSASKHSPHHHHSDGQPSGYSFNRASSLSHMVSSSTSPIRIPHSSSHIVMNHKSPSNGYTAPEMNASIHQKKDYLERSKDGRRHSDSTSVVTRQLASSTSGSGDYWHSERSPTRFKSENSIEHSNDRESKMVTTGTQFSPSRFTDAHFPPRRHTSPKNDRYANDHHRHDYHSSIVSYPRPAKYKTPSRQHFYKLKGVFHSTGSQDSLSSTDTAYSSAGDLNSSFSHRHRVSQSPPSRHRHSLGFAPGRFDDARVEDTRRILSPYGRDPLLVVNINKKESGAGRDRDDNYHNRERGHAQALRRGGDGKVDLGPAMEMAERVKRRSERMHETMMMDLKKYGLYDCTQPPHLSQTSPSYLSHTPQLHHLSYPPKQPHIPHPTHTGHYYN